MHAAAPGGVKDDARYRAQVQAILGFEPTAEGRRIIWQPGNTTNPEELLIETDLPIGSSATGVSRWTSGDELGGVPEDESVIQNIQPQREYPVAVCTTPRDQPHEAGAFVPSSDLSRECWSVRPKSRSHSNPKSFDSPISVIPDSQPNDIEPLHSPTSAEQAVPRDIVRGTQPVPEDLSSRYKQCRVGAPTNSPKAFLEKPECIPSSITTSGSSCSRDSHQHKNIPISGESTSNPTRNFNHNSKLSRRRQQQLVQLHQRMEIHPPSPPTGTGSFSTHITPTLLMLAGRLKLSRIFNPLKQTRSLKTLERGYWRLALSVDKTVVSDSRVSPRATIARPEPQRTLPPHQWTHSFFSRVWNFLRNFIAREGLAGWGVWCLLTEVSCSSSLPSSSSITSSSPQLSPQLQTMATTTTTTTNFILKIYCWGEVAAHIYGLLFLATERRIRGMHLQWRDAADQVVIEMTQP